MIDSTATRKYLLGQWARIIWDNAISGAFLGEPFTAQIRGICGARARALRVLAGEQSIPFLRRIQQYDHALLMQLVHLDFSGDHVPFMSLRRLRVEAGWSDALAEKMVKLGDLGHCPADVAERMTLMHARNLGYGAALGEDVSRLLESWSFPIAWLVLIPSSVRQR